ncbi:hypothetical protein C2S53_000827 [Perilla frutescens var. hirtella]|uniref:Uncharacterized protein n=1 Tax=Perilla frutescens var. hirtella TaxID=608512 RepID=A0AAD4IQ73_PERFH|nr:hypothetical protein C2S53_000827 [Perilla frutescens var. hirtella]
MGSNGRLLFDLNEPPAENEDDNDGVVCFQPQRVIPLITATTDLFMLPHHPNQVMAIIQDSQDAEKEEREWSDAECSVDAYKRTVLREDSSGASDKQVSEKSTVEMIDNISPNHGNVKNENDKKSDASTDGLEESAPAQKQREIPAPTITRTMKEGRPALAFSERGDKQTQPIVTDTKQPYLWSNEGNNFVESNECKSENNGDYSSGFIGLPRRRMFPQKDKHQWFLDSCLLTQGSIKFTLLW